MRASQIWRLYIEGVLCFQEADLAPVTKALADAVTRSFPLPRYTPVTRKEKLQSFIANHFPQSLYDMLFAE